MKPGVRLIDNAARRETGAQLSPAFYQDCLRTHERAADGAAMVLNVRGEVLYCTEAAAEIFGNAPDQLEGRPLSEFVLNARLRRRTPGSNVAYATFSGRRGEWRECSILDGWGRNVTMELLLDVLAANPGYLILLWIRPPASRVLAGTARQDRLPACSPRRSLVPGWQGIRGDGATPVPLFDGFRGTHDRGVAQ